MKMRSKLGALLGAGLLTFGVASIALADTLNGSFVGKISDNTTGTAGECADAFPDLAAGEVGIQFNLGGANENDGTLDAAFSNPASTPHKDHADFNGGSVLKWYVTITGTGNTTLDSASTNATANAQGTDHLVVSHVCYGSPGGGGGGDTDQPPTDTAIGPTGSSGPTDTAWLLVVALGVLLASIVVLTPARAKSQR